MEKLRLAAADAYSLHCVSRPTAASPSVDKQSLQHVGFSTFSQRGLHLGKLDACRPQKLLHLDAARAPLSEYA